MIMSYQVDAYQKARGGYSQMLKITCSKCSAAIGLYQKDGPGPLKRMYVDRLHPVNQDVVYSEGQIMTCKECHAPLALAYIYTKENRPAWLLFAHAITLQPTNFLKNILFRLREIVS